MGVHECRSLRGGRGGGAEGPCREIYVSIPVGGGGSVQNIAWTPKGVYVYYTHSSRGCVYIVGEYPIAGFVYNMGEYPNRGENSNMDCLYKRKGILVRGVVHCKGGYAKGM